jgi:hypothetical protein
VVASIPRHSALAMIAIPRFGVIASSQRHLRGKLIFCAEGGRQLEENECKWPIWRACKR